MVGHARGKLRRSWSISARPAQGLAWASFGCFQVSLPIGRPSFRLFSHRSCLFTLRPVWYCDAMIKNSTAKYCQGRLSSRPRSGIQRHQPRHRMEKRSTTRPLVLSILTTTTLLSLACMFTRISTRRSLNLQATPTPFYTTRPYPPPSSFKVAPTPVDPGPSHSEKYLAYLPHSGFHNQRIALENVLVLASLLNRILLLPPVRLVVPLAYSPFDELLI